MPSAYAEHYKAYLPEQMEPISEEMTDNDRKWFYEQLDQGLLKESPEQKALRQQAWRLPHHYFEVNRKFTSTFPKRTDLPDTMAKSRLKFVNSKTWYQLKPEYSKTAQQAVMCAEKQEVLTW